MSEVHFLFIFFTSGCKNGFNELFTSAIIVNIL